MKLGIIANGLQDKPLDEALRIFADLGIEKFEPGCGGCAGKAHVNPQELLADPAKLQKFKDVQKETGVSVSVLSCHGNPIHPNRELAASDDRDMRDAVRLAGELGIDTISCFSGCAGDSPDSHYPNWVTCSWPEDYMTILRYQWEDVLVPYWKEFVEFAKGYGVSKIALEMHPGFMVHNSETAKRIHREVRPEMGVTFDPSHLVWQGMDPVAVIRELGDMIYNVHAKDVKVDRINTSVNGVLDTKHYSDEIHRSWIFRTVGYGHGAEYWKDIFSALRMVHYDGTISIEHEDSLINRDEGLKKAVALIRDCLIVESHTDMWWA